MPIYEYECAKCGKRIEIIQKMSDKPLKKHADCGGALQKLVSAAGFQFKGTGWYVTDYARKGKTESTESKETKETTSAKDSSSNGNKEGSGSKTGSEKTSTKDSSAKSGAKKD
jgi:putative FmdB family regulatory protein